MDKVQIRNEKLNERNKLSSEKIKIKSISIQNKILKSDIFKRAESIFCYINIRSEVETDILINESLNLGKSVAVPITVNKKGEMYFSKINILDLENLEAETFDLLEPVRKEMIEPDDNTLFVVPGASYDLKGNRVGYGAGYYDKYLKNKKYMHLLGICFDLQIVDSIKSEDFDVKMNSIVTENMWIFPKEIKKTSVIQSE